MGSFVRSLIKAKPTLPYLAFGAWLASLYLLSTGAAWLSKTEMTGAAISRLVIASSIGCACSMLLFSKFRVAQSIIDRYPLLPLFSGIVSAIGGALIVLMGPFYGQLVLPFSFSAPLFYSGGFLFGAGLGCIGIKNGMIYGSAAPREVLLQAASSELFVSIVFFITVGAPSWTPVDSGPTMAGIISLVGLPVVAGTLASLPFEAATCESCEGDISNEGTTLPTSFWKLLYVVFVFACIAVSFYSYSVTNDAIAFTMDGSRAVMLLRIAFSLSLMALALGSEKARLNFGTIYIATIVIPVFVIAVTPLASTHGPAASHVVALASVVFEFFLWCTLAFIVYQRKLPAVKVFGYGFGAYMIASAFGWVVGYQIMELLYDAFGTAFVSMGMAITILACAFIVFSEKDLDKLFAPRSIGAPTLQELLRQELLAEQEDANVPKSEQIPEASQSKSRFSQAIVELATRYHLTQREADILRCLALGYNNETTAEKLALAWSTVRTYRKSVYAKMGVHSNQELIALLEEELQRSGPLKIN